MIRANTSTARSQLSTRVEKSAAPLPATISADVLPGIISSSFERLLNNEIVFDHAPPDKVLLDDSLQHLGGTRVIPCSLGIYHGDRPLLADPQAVGFGAVDPPAPREAQLVEPTLQVVPGLQPGLERAALGFALIGAEEDVPTDRAHTIRHRNFLKSLGHRRLLLRTERRIMAAPTATMIIPTTSRALL